ncbi:TPA: hypothetical protein ACXLAJ_003512, partial [Pseudomonas aeruginosa]
FRVAAKPRHLVQRPCDTKAADLENHPISRVKSSVIGLRDCPMRAEKRFKSIFWIVTLVMCVSVLMRVTLRDE